LDGEIFEMLDRMAAGEICAETAAVTGERAVRYDSRTNGGIVAEEGRGSAVFRDEGSDVDDAFIDAGSVAGRS
jgi:hypothetical protein